MSLSANQLHFRRAVVSAARTPRYLPGDGPAFFLPYPLKRAAAALAVFLLIGCTSAAVRNANAVARSQNDRDFLEARYEDACRVASPPAPCAAAQKVLNTWLTDIRRRDFIDWDAPKPLKARTGPTPLHDAALVADEKAAKKAMEGLLP
jgi:hypothetical protein